MYIHIYIYMYSYIHLYNVSMHLPFQPHSRVHVPHIYSYIHMMCMHSSICICMCVSVFMCVFVYLCIYMYVSASVYMHKHTYVCIYIYTCIFTHIFHITTRAYIYYLRAHVRVSSRTYHTCCVSRVCHTRSSFFSLSLSLPPSPHLHHLSICPPPLRCVVPQPPSV